jgi:RNA polymerase sigma-70 factor, ECF subfamily
VAHDLDEIPMAELAEAARLPLSTLYKRRARALDALRDVLERLEAEEALMIRRKRGPS